MIFDRIYRYYAKYSWARLIRSVQTAPIRRLPAIMALLSGQSRDMQKAIRQGKRRFDRFFTYAAIAKSVGTDWAWRPELWEGTVFAPGLSPVPNATKLSHDVAIFHDYVHDDIIFRHFENARNVLYAPFGGSIEVFHFSGTFLSMAISLPAEAGKDLSLGHIISLQLVCETEMPCDILARLNVENGPNTEQILHKIEFDGMNGAVEFDLAYTELDEKRVGNIWIDLMFEQPAMNKISLYDVQCSRRMRSEV